MIILFLGLDARYVPAEPVSCEIRPNVFVTGGMANWGISGDQHGEIIENR